MLKDRINSETERKLCVMENNEQMNSEQRTICNEGNWNLPEVYAQREQTQAQTDANKTRRFSPSTHFDL